MAMRTGIMGGTFDPIHMGHLAIAENMRTALGLDRVLVLPTGQPPYKRCHAERSARLEMARLAIAGRTGMELCDIEIARPGDSYTVDTIRELRAMYPDDSFTWLLGEDALAHLHAWRDIDEIAGMMDFAVVARPGRRREPVDAVIARLSQRSKARVAQLRFDVPDISSGDIRARVAEGVPVEGFVPAAVADHIRIHGLSLCDYTEAALLDKLRSTITLHRYHHTLGVADTACRLASRFGVDPMRARLAGLLHDCAKSLPYGEMRTLVEQNVPDTDALELDAEPVLHAPAGMVLAKRDYGVRDASILQAIRRHTLGGDHMTAMDAVIYVSDFIEPGRRPFDGLERARAAAETDIFEAMRICADLTIAYLASRGQKPHPRTLMVLEAYAQEASDRA